MDFGTLLSKQRKKTLSKAELSELFHTADSARLHMYIAQCVHAGLLCPVKSSGTDGNLRYPVYLKYRITLPKPDDSEALLEIDALHPKLLLSGYLRKNPAIFLKHRHALLALSRYFQTEQPSISISRKERSFEIFQDEKMLDDRAFVRLLNALNIGAAELLFYDTPENCFADYIPCKKSSMTLLICENKDIWFNLRRIMYESGCFTLWDTTLDGVIYGEGNHITAAGALAHYSAFLQCEQLRYLYWGDIDREGLAILLRLQSANPQLTILPFLRAYEELLRRAEDYTILQSKDNRERFPDLHQLSGTFPSKLSAQIDAVLHDNLHIPQEIVSYAVLKQEMR